MVMLNIFYICNMNNIVTTISIPIFVFILQYFNYFILNFFLNNTDCVIPMFYYIIVVKNKLFKH